MIMLGFPAQQGNFCHHGVHGTHGESRVLNFFPAVRMVQS